jgi:hypothetical protein
LRFYPAVTEIMRSAKDDNILPLSKPILGVSGKVYNDIHVPAGTFMHISTLAYNLYVYPPDPHPVGNSGIEDVFFCFVGTRTYGDQMLMNFDRNGGSI